MIWKILFILVQLLSLFDEAVVPVSQIENIPAFQSVSNGELVKRLNVAAGVDENLSSLEWKLYLKASPTYAFNKTKKNEIEVVANILKNGSPKFKPLMSAEYSFKALLQTESQKNYDLIVYGNEVPGIAAAVSAARIVKNKGKVLLIRPNTSIEPFGGILVQGGLAYLDRNQMNSSLAASSEFYREFLNRAKVKKIAIDPDLAHKALEAMLKESGVIVISGCTLTPVTDGVRILAFKNKSTEEEYKAKVYMDASQNADLARLAELKQSVGFATLGFPGSTLPVSPIFTTKNLSAVQLKNIELRILKNPELMKKIQDKIKAEVEPKFAEWLLQKLDAPLFLGEDYVDVRSIALGAAYHLYRNKPYDFKKGFLFDRPNIAVLSDGSLSWNALLYKFSAEEVMNLVAEGSKPTPEMLLELQALESWFRTFPEGSNTVVASPQELYIRHSLNIVDVKDPLTGKEIILGGTSPQNSVGSFSYFFDVRGGIQGFGGKMPKPVFNFGIEHCLTRMPNFAVVGRSAGYYGLAPAVGRILELNVSIGANLGAAAALAISSGKELNQITSAQAREETEKLTGLKVILGGKDLSQETDLSRII